MSAKSAAALINTNALRSFEENGYWIESNLLTPGECDALIEAGNNLAHFKEGHTRPAMMPHRESPLILQAMKNPKAVALLEQMLGGKVDALQSQFFYCKPGTQGFSLHQDNFFVEAPMGAFGSIWIALTDIDAEKGGLLVYPGSHKEGLLPVRRVFTAQDAGQDPNANNEEAAVPAHYAMKSLKVPKGAGVFLHAHIVHGSHPNKSQQWRYVLLNTYIRQGEPFRAGKYARRETISVYE